MKALEIWQERARSLRFDDDVVEGVKGGCPDEVTYFQEPPCLTPRALALRARPRSATDSQQEACCTARGVTALPLLRERALKILKRPVKRPRKGRGVGPFVPPRRLRTARCGTKYLVYRERIPLPRILETLSAIRRLP